MGLRNSPCPRCGKLGYWHGGIDRFACLTCDEWIDRPCGCPPDTCEFAAAHRGILKPSDVSAAWEDVNKRGEPKAGVTC